MHFQLTSVLSIAFAAVAIASPTWQEATWEHSPAHKGYPKHTSPRPDVKCHPKSPHKPSPSPPARSKTCYIQSAGNGIDDSPAILSALHECNNGGHVVFSKGITYLIGTAMDWTFLKHIDLGMPLHDAHKSIYTFANEHHRYPG